MHRVCKVYHSFTLAHQHPAQVCCTSAASLFRLKRLPPPDFTGFISSPDVTPFSATRASFLTCLRAARARNWPCIATAAALCRATRNRLASCRPWNPRPMAVITAAARALFLAKALQARIYGSPCGEEQRKDMGHFRYSRESPARN